MKLPEEKSSDLKAIFDLKGRVNDEAFEKLNKFVDIRELTRKKVVRHAGAVETESRYLIAGLIGMYFKGKVIRLFLPGDVFMDYESYRTQEPSKYSFRTMDSSVFVSLTYTNEALVLKEIPELAEFSNSQIAKVRNADFEWHAFSQMNYRDKIRLLEEKLPNFNYILTNQERASILGVSYSTAARTKKESSAGTRYSMRRDKLLEELHYPFPAYMHPDAEEIEELTVAWASIFHRLLSTKEEIAVYRKNKFSYLSSCLYPEIDFKKGLWISKLYLWLFFLDDLTDVIPKGEKGKFWEILTTGIELVIRDEPLVNFSPKFLDFLEAFRDLLTEFYSLADGNEELLNIMLQEIRDFFKSNMKESGLKDAGTRPTLVEYKRLRPLFSGGKLAVALSSFESDEVFSPSDPSWRNTQNLRELGAKLIYLSNDLISVGKESRLGDFMNYVTLVASENKWGFERAHEFVLQEHADTLREFMKLEGEWRSVFNPENNGTLKYLKQIKYKIAGTVYWSLTISPRYAET